MKKKIKIGDLTLKEVQQICDSDENSSCSNCPLRDICSGSFLFPDTKLNKEIEIEEKNYENQFGSEIAIRICKANNLPLSDVEVYGSDVYWINDGINNLEDLYDINENFVIPTGDEDLIRDYREQILEEEE